MLDHDRFIVKEEVRLIRTVDAYQIFDANTGQPLGEAQNAEYLYRIPAIGHQQELDAYNDAVD